MTSAEWYGMDDAPRDGREVMLMIRHPSWNRARPEDRHRWQAEVRGRWTSFNGGGWTWFGLAGTQIAWRPMTERDPVTIDG